MGWLSAEAQGLGKYTHMSDPFLRKLGSRLVTRRAAGFVQQWKAAGNHFTLPCHVPGRPWGHPHTPHTASVHSWDGTATQCLDKPCFPLGRAAPRQGTLPACSPLRSPNSAASPDSTAKQALSSPRGSLAGAVAVATSQTALALDEPAKLLLLLLVWRAVPGEHAHPRLPRGQWALSLQCPSLAFIGRMAGQWCCSTFGLFPWK